MTIGYNPRFGEPTEAGGSFGVVGKRAVECCAELEAALSPFSARPHWGKLFTMGKEELSAVYGAGEIAKFR